MTTDDLIQKEKITEIVYEATRLEAKWSNRTIVPEKWNKRDEKFKKQFVAIIEKYLNQKRLPTPKQAHDSWTKAYEKMGWKYGKKRDVVKKTHPDILPFEKLPKDERDKDAIFLMAVWVMKQSISSLHKIKDEAKREWATELLNKHTDDFLGTTDYDAIAEDILNSLKEDGGK